MESINEKIINLIRILHLYLHELERNQKSRIENVSMSDKLELVQRDSKGEIMTRLNN